MIEQSRPRPSMRLSAGVLEAVAAAEGIEINDEDSREALQILRGLKTRTSRARGRSRGYPQDRSAMSCLKRPSECCGAGADR